MSATQDIFISPGHKLLNTERVVYRSFDVMDFSKNNTEKSLKSLSIFDL